MTSSQPITSTLSPALLSATYNSPTNAPFTHTQTFPALQTTSAKERTAYLGALRNGVTELQEKINKDLTSRMEEDNTKAQQQDVKGKGKDVVDEKKEEDNYGEEIVEED